MRSWLLLVLAGCAAGSTPGADDFRERLLATVPANAHLHGLAVFSEDGRRVAYVERDDGVSRAVSGAWKSRPFSLVC